MEPFLGQLARLCQDQPTRSKWVIVTSHALGHTLGDRLVLEGTSWANLRFRTPFDLALETAAPFLAERGADPIPDDLGAPLIMRLLGGLPAGTPSYFRHLAYQPTAASALWATVRELRMAGLGAADLPASAFEHPAKHAELQTLIRAYETDLDERGLADAPAVFAEAITRLDECPILARDIRIELPEVIWPPLVRCFLDALPGTRLDPDVLERPGLTVPRRLGGRPSASDPGQARRGAVTPNPGAGPARDVASLRWLMRPDLAPSRRQDGSLTMFRAGGMDAEVEEVFRRIAATDLPFDAVEIACASPEYPLRIWQKARRDGWPVTLAGGIPVVVTRPGRALLGWLDWIESGYPASRLRRLLQSGDVRLDLEDGPSAGQAARLLAASRATWGRETCSASLLRLAESERRRAADPDAEDDDAARQRWLTRATEADRLRDWIDRLIAMLPAERSGDGAMPLRVLIAAARQFVANQTRRGSELDAAAAYVITVALDRLAVVGDLNRPASEAIRLLRAALEEATAGSDRARPGHLHVTRLARAGWAGRPHTFVVGLEEGRVLPSRVEDAVLLDDEREQIHPMLATSRDRATEAVHTVVSRLAAIGASSTLGSLTASYSCRDLRQYRETFPSWLLLQVRRLGVADAVTYNELIQDLGEPRSAVPARPAEALGDAGWWMSHLVHQHDLEVGSLLAVYPSLRQGRAAEAARDSDTFTIYDGYVPDAGPRLDLSADGTVISATRLEHLARCPFSYFLKTGLGLEAIDERAPDSDAWLDALTRGAELHALYARVMRRLRQAGRGADLRTDRPWLRARATERIERLRRLMPPPSDAVFQRERSRLLDDLELFLELEAEHARDDRTPIAFEVGFGLPDGAPEPPRAGDEQEELAMPEPVKLVLGRSTFRLRGRIDRIDRVAAHDYEVVDYKTGWYSFNQYHGLFRGGRLLQHALYGLAAAELLRPRDPKAQITASVYYFPSARAGGQAARKPRPSAARIAGVLEPLGELVAAGAFVHTIDEDEEDCRYCDFQNACGARHLERAARKIDEPANTVLDAYRRLMEQT